MPRKELDGIKLIQDVAQMQAADKMSPPSARPSLMDAVRALATYIDTRAKLGWTDTMIAAVLTEAGYAIDAATLRSYRKRMRDAGQPPPKPVPSPVTSILPVMPTVPVNADPIPTGKVVVPAGTPPAGTAASLPKVSLPKVEPPPGASAPPKRSFSIDPSNLKPDRA